MINFNNGTLRVQGKWLYPNGTIPKVDLPPYTMRIEYLPGVTPWNGDYNPNSTFPDSRYLKGTVTQVSVTPNIWDWHFKNCGINTPTGLAELKQIPQSWGGLAAG